jgi:hypothetical protein
MRRRLRAVAVGAILAAGSRAALAAPTLVSSQPTADTATRAVSFFVGAIDESGRSLKVGSIELVLDGQPAGTPATSPTLSDWAAPAADANAAWRPPLAVGLVYLWIDGVPSGLLEGLHSFFERLPPRTTIYPTIYGRLRQGRARLAAADVGRLDELPYLESYRPNLVDAVDLDRPDLAAEDVPLKILLLVSDGRDFADPKGEGPGDFAALGRRLHDAGITPLVVGFPPRDAADAAQAAANLRDLHDAAGGYLRMLDQADELENTLESLGQALADLRRVEVAQPLGWRLFAGSHRVSVRLTTSDQRLSGDVGVASSGGGGGLILLVIGAAFGLSVMLGIVLVVLRRRRADLRDGAGHDEEAVVTAAHDLIRRGVSPQRALEELSRGRGSAVRVLVDLDPEILNDPRFPYFRTRPGRLRIKEMQDLLSKNAAVRAAIGETLAAVLAESIKKGLAPEQTAETLAARVTPEETAAFAAMGLEDLARALRDASSRKSTHAILASPRARGVAVAVQDALRSKNAGAQGVAVAWLVRAKGPGRRGETLRLAGARSLLGRAEGCTVRLQGDAAVADEHAEILSAGGEFIIAPLGGTVSVEARRLMGRRTLSDGETIELGAGVFIFKAARSGNTS